MDSRVKGTRTLAKAMAAAENPPSVFLSGSAIGYYGDTEDQRITEESLAADDFAAVVTVEWEKQAAPIATERTRLAYLRTGIVLDPSGGALKEQLPFFKLGLGGRIGSTAGNGSAGSRLHDEVERDPAPADRRTTSSGPVNLTAPNPVTNAEFTKALGKALNRPTLHARRRSFALWACGSGKRARRRRCSLGGAHVSPTVLLQASGFEFGGSRARAGARSACSAEPVRG